MKKILVLCIFILSITPTYAKDTKTIIVYGTDLNAIFLLRTDTKSSIQLITINTTTLLEPTCASTTLASISSLTTSRECLLDSIEKNFNLTIDNYIDLNITSIEKDYSLSLTASDLHTFNDIQIYFEELGTSIDMSVIWKFREYMNTDLNLKEIYDFYSIYSADTLTITYLYPFLIQADKFWIPLNQSFS